MTAEEYYDKEEPIDWIGDPRDDWFFGKNDMIKFAKGYANHQTASLREELENTRRVYEYHRDEHRKVEKDRDALREEIERLKKQNIRLRSGNENLGNQISQLQKEKEELLTFNERPEIPFIEATSAMWFVPTDQAIQAAKSRITGRSITEEIPGELYVVLKQE